MFWQTPLQRVWKALAHLPRFGDIAEIHRGIEYEDFRKRVTELVFTEPALNLRPGLVNINDGFEPYVTPPPKYLAVNPETIRSGHKFLRRADQPKIIANAARLSRGPWTIAGAIDNQGLVCSQRFHGIWPKTSLPLEVIAAVLNG